MVGLGPWTKIVEADAAIQWFSDIQRVGMGVKAGSANECRRGRSLKPLQDQLVQLRTYNNKAFQ